MTTYTRPDTTATISSRASAKDHLAVLRGDFDEHAGRSLALPVAGAIVWSAIGVAALILPPTTATLLLLFGTGAIFPLGLAVAHQLGERLIDNPSPLAALMGRCVLMVNLLWAVHLTVFALVPTYLPLTIGIGLGLHWIVFGWIIDHPVGLIHAATRTALVTTAWWLIPTHRISAVAAAVVATYAYTLYALATRPRPAG
jgi:hypothetical protein